MSHRKSLLSLLVPAILWASGPALFLTACGGGGGGGDGTAAPDPITSLTYPIEAVIYLIDQEIEATAPTVVGTVETWTVSPALPSGLSINGGNGKIRGEPTTVTPLSSYSITAANSVGSLSYDITIGVEAPPALAFTVGKSDGVLGVYGVDAEAGTLAYHTAVDSTAGATPAGQIVQHPSGAFLYRMRSIDTGVSGGVLVNSLDVAAGRVEDTRLAVDLPGSPLAMAFNAAGDMAYVIHARPQKGGSLVDIEVSGYAIDQETGELSPIGATRLLAIGDDAATAEALIAVDPLGAAIYTAHLASQNLNILPIKDDGSLKADVGPQVLNGTPSDLTMDAGGKLLFVTVSDVRFLLGFLIDRPSGRFDPAIRVRSLSGSPSSVAVHPTERFVYVTLKGEDQFARFDLDTESGTIGQNATKTDCPANPLDLAFDASGQYAFVISAVERELWSYRIEASTGDASPIDQLRTAQDRSQILLAKSATPADRRARFAYVLNKGDQTINSYRLNGGSGKPTELAAGPVMVGNDPTGLAGDPAGQFIYALSSEGGSPFTDEIAAFPINPSDGSLRAPVIANTGENPRGVTTGPAGTYVFVSTDSTDAQSYNRLIMYELDRKTGALNAVAIRAIAGSPQGADVDPGVVVVDPTGHFVYVLSRSLIATFVIDSTQGNPLVPSADKGGADAVVTGDPVAMTFSQDGRQAYVVLKNLDFVVVYDVHKNHGQLTNPQVYDTDGGAGSASQPLDLAIHPGGLWAFIANSEYATDGSIDTLDIEGENGRLDLAWQTFGGLRPTALGVDPEGRFLYAVHGDGDDLAQFSIDSESGALTLENTAACGADPSALVLLRALE